MASAAHAKAPVPLSALRELASDNVITGAALNAAGVARSTIAYRCKAGGPWTRLLPGVILLDNAEPTRWQLLRAAVCQLGEPAVITGADALRALGIKAGLPMAIHVLVPAGRRVQPSPPTMPERTTRLPGPFVKHGLPFAPPARAAVDAARHQNDPRQLPSLLRLPIEHGLCSAGQLRDELQSGNQRGTADIRAALREIGPHTAGRRTRPQVHGAAARQP